MLPTAVLSMWISNTASTGNLGLAHQYRQLLSAAVHHRQLRTGIVLVFDPQTPLGVKNSEKRVGTLNHPFKAF